MKVVTEIQEIVGDKMRIKFSITFFSFLITLAIYPQNFNDALRVGIPGLGMNARALGMGNSYLALSDDGSASFFNPAGLGLVRRLEFMGGLDISSFNNTTTFFGNQTKSNATQTKLNNASFTFPIPTIRGSLVFGLAYNQNKDLIGSNEFDGFNSATNSKIQSLLKTDIPYDLFLTDDDGRTIINGRLNQSGNMLNSGSINSWTLTGAIEAYKNLFIGANLSIISGNYTSDFDYYEDDTKNNYQGVTAPCHPKTTDFRSFHLKNLLKWELEGWNAKIGFLYQLDNFGRIGATVQFPKLISVKEKFIVEGSSEFANWSTSLDPDDYSDEVKYDIKTPFEVSGGFSFNLQGLILSGQLNFINYTELEFSDAEGLSQSYISDQNKKIKSLLRHTINYNLGAEYTVPNIGLRLRGGYIFQKSPFDDDDTEFDKKYITGGVGILTDGVIGIDIGYAYGWWKDIGDNYSSNLSRTFQDIKFHKFIITTTYRF
jgi:hypothetical protein